MGLCCSAPSNPTEFTALLRHAIEEDDVKKVKRLSKMLEKSHRVEVSFTSLDEIQYSIKGIDLTPLAYSVWMGSRNSFQYLLEKTNSSQEEMEKCFTKFELSALSVMCMQGYLSMIKYYLPVYLKKIEFGSCSNDIDELSDVEDSMDVDGDFFNVRRDIISSIRYTPIQLACECGKIDVVQFITEYFRDKDPPVEFDFEYQDEVTGENSALIAVRQGNMELVRYLGTNTGVNFNVYNKRGESALHIAIVMDKIFPQRPYLEVIKYLIEEMDVDLVQGHEEALLVCDNPQIVGYIEEKLAMYGIHTTKEIIEEQNKIEKVKGEEDLGAYSTMLFSFKDLFAQTYPDYFEQSVISTIPMMSVCPSDTYISEYTDSRVFQANFQKC